MLERRRISSLWLITGIVFGVLVFAVGAVIVWPQWFGLQREILISQIISFRLVFILVLAGVLVLVLIFLVISRQTRALFAGTAVALTILLLASGANYLGRGIGAPTPATGAPEAVRVLTWNTLGNEPGSPTVAQLALDYDVDVMMLPETTEDFGVEVAGLMSAAGKPMWVLSATNAPGYRAAETTLLVSADLGEYQLTGEYGNTQTLATVVAEPVDGDGPRFVAAHPVAPTPSNMDLWRSDLEWLAGACQGDTILAGDFNATLDHLIGFEDANVEDAVFGACSDAAQDAGSASVGTWPSGRHPLLVPAIDHVMSTQQWETTGFEVITREDRSGSDHRPVFAELTPVA